MDESGLCDDLAALDALAARFFAAFANPSGVAAAIDDVYAVCIPEAIVINNAGDPPEVYDLARFVEPRRALLSGGTLTAFSESEVSATTEIVGGIAQRLSRYRKSGVLNGKPFAGSGAKTIQFVRTRDGWKISAVAWDDEPFRR